MAEELLVTITSKVLVEGVFRDIKVQLEVCGLDIRDLEVAEFRLRHKEDIKEVEDVLEVQEV